MGPPGPSLVLDGEMLDIEAQRRGGVETKCACPMWLLPKSDRSFYEAWR